MEHSIARCTNAPDQNLGHLEVQAARDVQELLRAAMERGAQAKADATPPLCPVCQQKLTRLSADQPRTFESRYGSITVKRTRGYCKRCRKWRVPADTALGLEESAGYSPAVQEMASLLASKMPVEDASAVLEHLTGVKMPRATLDREARRQGERAQGVRTELDRQAATQKPQLELTLEPYQMIIQMDAWNIRERDGWGQSAALRRKGQEPERWHWVYTGTVFRLDHRGQTAGGRPVISERGFVATRQGIDALRDQLHAEALRRGLGQAASALIIGDGAVWIWRLADDRFPAARQRLDFYHAVQHLAAVGQALFGEDKEKYRSWLKPLIQQLKNQSAIKVIKQLEEALMQVPDATTARVVAKEVNYFHEHQGRMDYRVGRRAGEPIGSGPVEATCRQTQCRFKRPGQFWSKQGDEALLCLEMFWRNNRWHLLFPHSLFNPARN
ncbi:MAG TPA: ISKra4 family transposase [Candidatus Angelobacter sp.]|nr:ISKra4 family transposase [Candidatus Angelobacter sp.]